MLGDKVWGWRNDPLSVYGGHGVLIPSTHTKQLTTTCMIPTPGDAIPSPGLQKQCAHVLLPIPHIHIISEKQISAIAVKKRTALSRAAHLFQLTL